MNPAGLIVTEINPNARRRSLLKVLGAGTGMTLFASDIGRGGPGSEHAGDNCGGEDERGNGAHVNLHGSYWTLAGDADPTPGPGREWSRFGFEERVELAAEMGFSGFGLWHADLRHILKERSLAEMREIFDANGIDYIELEFLDAWFLEDGSEARERADERWKFLLRAADALDAHHIKVGNILGLEAPFPQVAESFQRLSREAAAHDTLVGYEMMPVDVNVTSLDEMLTVTRGVSNGGVVLDTWHVVKMDVPFEELTRIAPENLVHVELNDGYDSPKDITTQTTSQRMLPGEGEFNVPAFIDAVQEIGYDGPWGVEVLSEYLRGLPMEPLFERSYEKSISQFEK